jgi:hypothetical protein
MIATTEKQTLLSLAKEQYKNQFDLTLFDPSTTMMGPCLWKNKKFLVSSWYPTFPMFPKYIERFTGLEEKYKHIDYLPIDIPKLEISDFDKFVEIFNKEAIEIKSTETDEPAEFVGMHIHMASVLDYVLHDLYDDNGSLTYDVPDIIENYPNTGLPKDMVGNKFTRKIYKDRFFNKLIFDIMQTYPIHSLANILIVKPIADVKPRREQTWVWNCPTEFRTVLHDGNTDPTFYVSDIESDNTKYIQLPEDTNTFAFSNGSKVHGIDYYNKDSYYLIVNAIWDSYKVETLLDKSIEKYGIL